MISLLIQLVLFVVTLALLLAALTVSRSAVDAADYQTFEARSAVSLQLLFAGNVLVIVEFLIGIPLLGAVLAVAAILWSVSWLPKSRRQFDVVVTSAFDASAEAVAAVMFDVSQQPRWQESIVATSLETPGLLRVGSVIRQTVRIQGHDIVARLVVAELVPYERLVLRLAFPDGRELRDEMEVQPQGTGAVAKYAGHHELSRLNAILTGWRLPAVRERFAKRRLSNLERLRDLVHPAPLARRA
ncbi:MAG TPA: SRPBCC family protein [Candidatus Limnocylindria bacterium]